MLCSVLCSKRVNSGMHRRETYCSPVTAVTATGTWAMEDRIWWPEGSPVRFLHGYGHYHETYVVTERGWRIATMRLTRLRVDVESGSPNDGPDAKG